MEIKVSIPFTELELYRRKTVRVKPNEGAGLSFMVKPKRVGPMNIKVTAQAPRAGDGVERILLVEPEGVPQFENMAMLIDLRDKTQFDGNFTFEIPKNAVQDSTKIEISAVGKLFNLLEPRNGHTENSLKYFYR